MTTQKQWQDFIKARKADFIGGDIEHTEDPEGTFRGPIKAITIDDKKVTITTEWTAHLATSGRGIPRPGAAWAKVTRANGTTFTYDFGTKELPVLSTPKDIGQGRVHFTYPFSGITLFPKGGSKLDPQKVRGM